VQDVHFGYTGEREVVGGISLSVEPGQSIALVGPSGSGKSTILKLLMRLYDVNSGSIMLDGIDTRDLQQVHTMAGHIHQLSSGIMRSLLDYPASRKGWTSLLGQQLEDLLHAAMPGLHELWHTRVICVSSLHARRVHIVLRPSAGNRAAYCTGQTTSCARN